MFIVIAIWTCAINTSQKTAWHAVVTGRLPPCYYMALCLLIGHTKWGAAQCALTFRGADTPVPSFSSGGCCLFIAVVQRGRCRRTILIIQVMLSASVVPENNCLPKNDCTQRERPSGVLLVSPQQMTAPDGNAHRRVTAVHSRTARICCIEK